MKHILTYIQLLLLVGCTATPTVDKKKVDSPSQNAVSLNWPKLSNEEIATYEKGAKKGSPEAAYRLYVNYAFADYNGRLREKYYKRALELEHPAILYDKAFWMWSREEHPNVESVEKLIRRAIELGYIDEKGLLEEVVAARETGIVPRQSKFRLFPGK